MQFKKNEHAKWFTVMLSQHQYIYDSIVIKLFCYKTSSSREDNRKLMLNIYVQNSSIHYESFAKNGNLTFSTVRRTIFWYLDTQNVKRKLQTSVTSTVTNLWIQSDTINEKQYPSFYAYLLTVLCYFSSFFFLKWVTFVKVLDFRNPLVEYTQKLINCYFSNHYFRRLDVNARPHTQTDMGRFLRSQNM